MCPPHLLTLWARAKCFAKGYKMTVTAKTSPPEIFTSDFSLPVQVYAVLVKGSNFHPADSEEAAEG